MQESKVFKTIDTTSKVETKKSIEYIKKLGETSEERERRYNRFGSKGDPFAFVGSNDSGNGQDNSDKARLASIKAELDRRLSGSENSSGEKPNSVEEVIQTKPQSDTSNLSSTLEKKLSNANDVDNTAFQLSQDDDWENEYYKRRAEQFNREDKEFQRRKGQNSADPFAEGGMV